MKRKMYIGLILFLILLILSGCDKEVKEPQPVPKPPEEIKPPSEILISIMPQDTKAQYIYNGFAEYGHIMSIDNIEDKEGQKIYYIKGEVDDPSGGEAKGNFYIDMQYIIDAEKVTEKIIQGEKLPHKIQELEVLKLPLEKGNTWDQKVIIDGKEQILKAVIESIAIDPKDNLETYEIVYSVPMIDMPNDIYEERRVYKKGMGLVSFENTIGKEYDFNFHYELSFIDKDN